MNEVTTTSEFAKAPFYVRLKDRFVNWYMQWHSAGFYFSLPFMLIFVGAFLVPLLIVVLFGVMPEKSTAINAWPTLDNYIKIFSGTYYKSLLGSFSLAIGTVVILLIICYPLAFAMVKVFKGFTDLITMAIVISLFVSENIRLFGWVLALMKNGIMSGICGWLHLPYDGLIYNTPVIIFGMVYVYLPFMLFPLTLGISMIPNTIRETAWDLGANRWNLFWKIDLPLSMPGVVIGSVLTFVLSIGALAESKILGGERVVTIASEIEGAFTYGQNWPVGSALSTVLLFIVGVVTVLAFRSFNPEESFGKRK